MRIRYYNLCIAAFLLLTESVKAQDYRFSQFYNTPLNINPAFAGNHNNDYRLVMNYKNQWSSISNAYRTISGSYDMPMLEDIGGISKLGVGIAYLSDKAGTTNYGFNNLSLSIAYHLKTDRYTMVSAGLMLGYSQSKADLNNVKWESQHNGNNFDPTMASGETAFVDRINYLDAGIGLAWTRLDYENDKEYEFGISVMHVNFPNQSFKSQYNDRLQPKIQLSAGVDIGYETFTLKPKLLVQNQGPAYSVQIGSLVNFNLNSEPESKYTDANVSSSVDFGVFYRYHESVIIVAQYEFHRKLLIAMSYDVNISKISTLSSSGGFEIALKYQGLFKNQRIKIKNQMDKNDKDQPKQKGSKKAPNIRM